MIDFLGLDHISLTSKFRNCSAVFWVRKDSHVVVSTFWDDIITQMDDAKDSEMELDAFGNHQTWHLHHGNGFFHLINGTQD